MADASHELAITPQWIGSNGRVQLTARIGDEVLHSDKLDLGSSSSRKRFAKSLAKDRPGLDEQDIEAILLNLFNRRSTAQAEASDISHGDLVERADPIPLAEHFLDSRYRDSQGKPLLRRWRGDFYQFTGSCYERVSDEALDAKIYRHVQKLWTIDGTGRKIQLRPTYSLVREVRLALPSRYLLIDEHQEAPLWLTSGEHLSPLRIIRCLKGIVDLTTGQLEPSTPDLFSLNAFEVDYDPEVGDEPEGWYRFLNSLWPDDPASIFTLQHWFGYCLTPDTRLQKILLLVGPKRAGKGTIARGLTGLVGTANAVSPTLASMATNFGLSPLLGKLVGIISDARLSGRSDQAVVTERLLSISGEDHVTVDRKYREPVTVKLPTRLMVLTNELPRLADSSGAMASRFVVLKLTESFYGREDHGLTGRLLGELPQILNWAIRGWRLLHQEGRFIQPASAAEAIQALEDLGSPISAFIRDFCVVAPGQWVETKLLFERWQSWCESEGRDHPGTSQTFGRDLHAAVPGIRVVQPRDGGQRQRVYQGIGLKGGTV